MPRLMTSLITDDKRKEAMPLEQDPVPLASVSQVAITTTTIPSLSWAVQRIYWASWADYQARRLTVAYKLANQGTGVAIGATIAASTCTPSSVYVTTALPLPVGDLEPGISSTVSLKYYVPANVGSFTTTTYVNSRDDAARTYWYPRPMP